MKCFFLVLTIFALRVYAEEFKGSVNYIGGKPSWPYIIHEQDEVKGILPDSIYAIFNALGINVTTTSVIYTRTMHELVHQRADVSMAVLDYNNLEEKDYPAEVYLCPTPILLIDVHMIWHKDVKIDTTEHYNINDYKIGVIRVSSKRFDKLGDIKGLVKFRTLELMVKNLLARRVDAIIMNGLHAKLIAKQLSKEDKLRQGALVMKMPIHLVVAKHWLKPGALMDKLCGTVATLEQDNVFKKISDSYLQQP